MTRSLDEQIAFLDALYNQLPKSDRQSLSLRSAQRAFPLWGSGMAERWAKGNNYSVLPVLRRLLVEKAVVEFPQADLAQKKKDSVSDLEKLINAVSLLAEKIKRSKDNKTRSLYYSQVTAIYGGYALDGADSFPGRGVVFKGILYDVEQAESLYIAQKEDATLLRHNIDLSDKALWTMGQPDWFQEAEQTMQSKWDEDPYDRWHFWRRWWHGVVTGHPLDPQLQLAIVEGIDDETWKDPDAVAARILEIEAAFKPAAEDSQSIEHELSGLPKASQGASQNVSRAMIEHRRELPPTFETLLGYLSLEVERLQNRNYRDHDDAEEARRQISVLKTIYEAIERLKALVPEGEEMPQAQADEAEALTRLIFRRIVEWPRALPGEAEDNIGELVDNSIRGTLIGGFAYLAPMVAVSPSAALVAGTVVFGGKKIVDAAKAAKGMAGS
ncbi:hypothetical protein [Marivita sp.]|jgi:hypothetical protein|uniref:hypothetical protein n=1 Tax=Marivita sp. TaxID=2003365 RepID=UPI003F6D6ABC